MYILKTISYCLIAFLLPLAVCAHSSQSIVMTQTHYQVPVLVLKKDNPVLRIHIHIDATINSARLTEMVFNTSGSTDWKDIQEVRLYYAGADSGTTNLANTEKLQLVGIAGKAGEKLLIKGDKQFFLVIG